MSALRPILSFLLTLLLAAHAYSSPAVSTNEDQRNAVLLQWEQTIKSDPSTRSFEPTDDPDIFEIENAILPYKGRIKISNVQIAPFTPRGDFESNVTYGAVIDTNFLDPHSDFKTTNAAGYERWQKLGWLNYDTTIHQWFPFSEWPKHRRALSSSSSGTISLSSLVTTGLDQLLPAALILALFICLKRQRKETQRNTEVLNEVRSILRSK